MRRSVRWATTLGIVLALGLGAAACGGDDEGGGGGDEQGASAGAPVEGKQGGKLTVLPPGVPEERVALLRKAFVDTMNDPIFLEDAKKIGLDTDPMNGNDMQALMRRLYATPPETVELTKRVLREAVEGK